MGGHVGEHAEGPGCCGMLVYITEKCYLRYCIRKLEPAIADTLGRALAPLTAASVAALLVVGDVDGGSGEATAG